MGMMNIISKGLNIFDTLVGVFFKERRKRARIQLNNLKREKKQLLKSKPDSRKAKKLIKINRKIKELNMYLRSD
jgi:hypothetical protein